MENNIFVKLAKTKCNPDVEPKLQTKEHERTTTTFNLTHTIYNPITGIIPTKVSCTSDLILDKDKTLNKTELANLISTKDSERKTQDVQYKPIKTKIISVTTPQAQAQGQGQGQGQGQAQVNRTNYIETFEDMKRGSSKPDNTVLPKKNFNNILDGLKDLGIIK
jgi:hypothetical protein